MRMDGYDLNGGFAGVQDHCPKPYTTIPTCVMSPQTCKLNRSTIPWYTNPMVYSGKITASSQKRYLLP